MTSFPNVNAILMEDHKGDSFVKVLFLSLSLFLSSPTRFSLSYFFLRWNTLLNMEVLWLLFSCLKWQLGDILVIFSFSLFSSFFLLLIYYCSDDYLFGERWDTYKCVVAKKALFWTFWCALPNDEGLLCSEKIKESLRHYPFFLQFSTCSKMIPFFEHFLKFSTICSLKSNLFNRSHEKCVDLFFYSIVFLIFLKAWRMIKERLRKKKKQTFFCYYFAIEFWNSLIIWKDSWQFWSAKSKTLSPFSFKREISAPFWSRTWGRK